MQIAFYDIISNPFYFWDSLMVVLIKMVAILIMLTELATLDFLELKIN